MSNGYSNYIILSISSIASHQSISLQFPIYAPTVHKNHPSLLEETEHDYTRPCAMPLAAKKVAQF